MYYDYSIIDGYQCPIKIVVSRRGLGKTFGKLKSFTEQFINKGYRFIYIVETGEMVKELTKNNGEKFWSALIDYYSEQNSARKRYYYSQLTSLEVEDFDDEDKQEQDLFGVRPTLRKIQAKIIGGTIKINGDTAGYILDMNSFGEIKRNNFNNVHNILIDEFISEKLDKTTLDNPRRVASIIQSIARLRNVKVYLLGNAIRKEDPILSRMGFKLKGYGFYKMYDNYGLLAVLHFVNPDDYKDFALEHDKSVAGRFSKMLGETNEEENKFISDLPESRRLSSLNYKKKGLSINIVKDNVIVSLKERIDGTIACVPFDSKNTKNLYCLTEKEQGFKLGYHIICNKELKQMIMNMIRADIIYYYSEIEYSQLKIIIKGD